jgi:hypothetical protein
MVAAHSRLFIAALLLSACGDVGPMEVSSEAYRKDVRCWLNSKGNLSAFIVMVSVGKNYVPYLLSSKCVSKVAGLKEEATTALSTGAVHLSDPSQLLRKSAGLSGSVINSDISDLPGPEASSPVFYVVAEASGNQANFEGKLSIKNVDRAIKLPVNYIELVEQSSRDRLEAALRIDVELF